MAVKTLRAPFWFFPLLCLSLLRQNAASASFTCDPGRCEPASPALTAATTTATTVATHRPPGTLITSVDVYTVIWHSVSAVEAALLQKAPSVRWRPPERRSSVQCGSAAFHTFLTSLKFVCWFHSGFFSKALLFRPSRFTLLP